MIRRLLVSGCIVAASYAQNTDSLAWAGTRARILPSDSSRYQATVRASDELAASGLFAEAAEMLRELPSVNAPGTPTAPADSARPRRIAWNAQAGADFLRADDRAGLDTSRQEVRDSLVRLTPFAAYVKAGFAWRPFPPAAMHLSPTFYISNQKTHLDVSGDGAWFNGALSAALSLLAEKRLVRTAVVSGTQPGDFLTADSSYWTGTRADSSDMLEVRLKTEWTPVRSYGRFSRIVLPASIDHQQYRRNTPGYISSTWWRTAPAADLVSADSRMSLGLSAPLEFREFHDVAGDALDADSFDYATASPELAADLFSPRWFAGLTVGSFFETYLHRGDPRDIRQFTPGARVHARISDRIAVSARAGADYQQERYSYASSIRIDSTVIRPPFFIPMDTAFLRTVQEKYELTGLRLFATPLAEFTLSALISAGIEIPIENGEYPLVADSAGGRTEYHYLRESFWSANPRIYFSLAHEKVNARISAGGMVDSIKTRPRYTIVSSRGIDAALSGDWQIVRALSLFVTLDYQWKRYAPYKQSSRSTGNIALSAGVLSRF
jgi:hypothetical protein